MTVTFEAPITAIESGRLRGVPGAVQRFLGIPYAAPPVGSLRWCPPRPAEPWTDVRDATHFGPDSYQQADSQLRGSSLSEDCLYLNVFTPATSAETGLLPVMVWIHGNGYTRGSGSHRTYDGAALARHGVVVVTINYRLGLAGFLSHPELNAESSQGSSGNYGLLDQIAALTWVQRNIHAFGGDARRVTVFGQSAGATCTGLLMASPLATGLFHQAILHSPGSMRPMATLEAASESGLRLGASIEALRALPIEQLWPLASVLIPPVRKLASPRGMGPIMDRWVVHGDDHGNYSDGRTRPMPLLVGATANEGRRLTERMTMRSAEEVLAHEVASFGDVTRIPAAYMPVSDKTAPSTLDAVVGDTQFNYGAWRMGEEMLKLGAPVYRYRFVQPQPGTSQPPTHDDELPYVFGTLREGDLWRGPRPAEELTSSDLALSEVMQRAWTSFARQGSPACVGLPSWPVARSGETMFFAQQPFAEPVPPSPGLMALQQFFGHGSTFPNDTKQRHI